MGRSRRQLPDGCSFHITLRCNSRAFLMARGVRRDLLQPTQGRDQPRIMQWIGLYSAMALNRLTGRCGHFWEARYFSTPIEPGDRLSEWHPAFLQLAPTLEGCARRYAHDCRRNRPRAKPARKTQWGSRLLQRDGVTGGKGAACRQGLAAGQQLLPWAGGGADLPLPMQWHQLAENFRRTNQARGSPWDGF